MNSASASISTAGTKKARYDFEFVGNNRILFKDRGTVVPEETLDTVAYELWVSSVREGSSEAREAQLIPSPYYRFMKDTKGPDWFVFDETRWANEFAPHLGDRICRALFPFQRHAIFKMVSMRRAMNACSPGLGKSIQALAALAVLRAGKNNASARDLIVCPSYLRANWLNEVRKWLPASLADKAQVINKAGKKDLDAAARTLLYHKGIVIVSYDMLASILSKVSASRVSSSFNTAILDESHFVKDAKTKRFQGIACALKRSKHAFLLTGTPSPNRVKELYSQFSIIAPSVFVNYRTFALRYCDGHEDRWRHFDDRGSSNVDELAFLMSKLAIRLRREDHLSDLPAVMREKVVLMPPKVSKSFQARKKKFLDELTRLDTDEGAKFRVQTLASEMFRETAALKVGPALEYLQGLRESNQGDEREKVVLFCKHQTMMAPVVEFLQSKGEDFIAISGSTDMKERPGLIDRFLTDASCTYAVLTIGSCATGLNIVPVSRMVFLELDWSPSTLDQCECRINRIGGSKALSYVYLVCQHTLDEMVFNKLKRKTTLASDVVDAGKRYGDFEFHATKRIKTATAEVNDTT